MSDERGIRKHFHLSKDALDQFGRAPNNMNNAAGNMIPGALSMHQIRVKTAQGILGGPGEMSRKRIGLILISLAGARLLKYRVEQVEIQFIGIASIVSPARCATINHSHSDFGQHRTGLTKYHAKPNLVSPWA